MINAGLPLVQCLEILSAQMDKPHFKQIITTVTSDVEGGTTLAEALGKHKEFSQLYVNMVEAGEAGGILDTILMRLAVYLEKAEALTRKVKTAMTYPTVVAVVALGATIFMLMFIIPTFAKMFTDFGGELPLPTEIVMGLSEFFRYYWYILLLGTGVSIFAFKRFYATDSGKFKIDTILLKVPALGNVIRKVGDRAFYADTRYSDFERCSHSERSGHNGPYGGEQGCRKSDFCHTRQHQPG